MSETKTNSTPEEFNPEASVQELYAMPSEDLRKRFATFARALDKSKLTIMGMIGEEPFIVEGLEVTRKITQFLIEDTNGKTVVETDQNVVTLHADYDENGHRLPNNKKRMLLNEKGEYGTVPLLEMQRSHLLAYVIAERQLEEEQQESKIQSIGAFLGGILRRKENREEEQQKSKMRRRGAFLGGIVRRKENRNDLGDYRNQVALHKMGILLNLESWHWNNLKSYRYVSREYDPEKDLVTVTQVVNTPSTQELLSVALREIIDDGQVVKIDVHHMEYSFRNSEGNESTHSINLKDNLPIPPAADEKENLLNELAYLDEVTERFAEMSPGRGQIAS